VLHPSPIPPPIHDCDAVGGAIDYLGANATTSRWSHIKVLTLLDLSLLDRACSTGSLHLASYVDSSSAPIHDLIHSAALSSLGQRYPTPSPPILPPGTLHPPRQTLPASLLPEPSDALSQLRFERRRRRGGGGGGGERAEEEEEKGRRRRRRRRRRGRRRKLRRRRGGGNHSRW
jgi:hypothetical protein